jgi:hypothetical protein
LDVIGEYVIGYQTNPVDNTITIAACTFSEGFKVGRLLSEDCIEMILMFLDAPESILLI